jgi:phage gp46-like protein
MNNMMTDLKLVDNSEYYDLSLNDDGSLAVTDGLNSSLIVSFFTDARAEETEVSNPFYRRGWWGNLFTQDDQPEYGSKIWLIDQAIMSDDTVNDAISYVQQAYDWLLSQNYADQVNVNAISNFNSLIIRVEIIKNSEIISQKAYNIWQNTILEIL